MDTNDDPLLNFFTAQQVEHSDLLYTTLNIPPTATQEDIRKAYRRLALVHHPDKQSTKSEKIKEDAAQQFQRIGFAYAVLSDEKRRRTYDATGKTTESAFVDAEEMGWDAYFETLFTRIDRAVLDEDKQKYQGSSEERDDLKQAYQSSKGSLPSILEHIPHATHDDENRLIGIINTLISDGDLESTKRWLASSTDANARSKRGKAAARQAKEAEQTAKELGVWDEFYGDGKKGARQGRKSEEGGLQALIRQRQKDRAGALDAMEEKYARMEAEEKAKKQVKGKKRKSDAEPSEMTDAEFEALQAKMFAKKQGTQEKKAKTTRA